MAGASSPARLAVAGETPAAELASKGLLRFLTCGSVDDGKSTLIGRLLFDSQHIMEDQLAQLETDSRHAGTRGGEMDLALLVDGLQAEREQGITIDVAFRYFQTPRRKFIVADTPGHEQYTRNMATGASVSDLAIILIDARKGVLTQTRRHSCIVSLLGIPEVVLAVNKMDLVDNSEARFREIERDYLAFASALGLKQVMCIPVSALDGDNVVRRSTAMPWYRGPVLLDHLESVDVETALDAKPFRFPVQWVNRPNADFRGFSGTVASGRVAVGDKVAVLPSGRTTSVARIVTYDGDLDVAHAGDAVTLVLADEVDVSRGDVIALRDDRPEVTDQAIGHVVWMTDEPLLPGRPYLIKVGTQWATANVMSLRHKINVESLEETAGRELALNEVGYCHLGFSRPLVFDPYKNNRETGGFILVDKLTYNTVGAGMLQSPRREATNIQWQAIDVDRAARAAMKGQKPCCIWFTGLSGSGKSTIANLLDKRLHSLGRHATMLDGDNVRHGLNRDLGFSDADRVENIRRVAEVAKLMVDAGLIVIVSFISPFRSERRMARDLFEEGEFVEVFVDTPLEVCESRDPKGLYRKARAGEIRNFTGISSPYERPENAEMRLEGWNDSPEALTERLIIDLEAKKLL
ncbi:MAG: sulfate adenylyltransferase subunit CysN [Hyphomicrobiaceae bacterium]